MESVAVPVPAAVESPVPAPAVSPVPREAAPEGYTGIYSPGDLLRLFETPDGNFALMNDLDLSGMTWQPFGFSGTLDGCGHTLYNLSVSALSKETYITRDGNMKPYPDTVFCGLFSSLRNAEVRNLCLAGVEMNIKNPGDCFAGILAGYAENALVENCVLQGRVQMESSGVNSGVGGIIGYGTASVSNCRVEAELVFSDRNPENVRCEQFLGGILASGLADLLDNNVELYGFIACHGYVHSGGLVGMHYDMGFPEKAEAVTGNTVTGSIRFWERNPDRRAYCSAVIGEDMYNARICRNNDTSAFLRDELFDYSAEPVPERCAVPEYETVITEPEGTKWGYTVHTCRICGYSWIDSYIPPE